MQRLTRTGYTLGLGALVTVVACATGADPEGADVSEIKQADGGFNEVPPGADLTDDGGAEGGTKTCAYNVVAAAERPLSILLLVDRSRSMLFENKWLSVSGAMREFFQSPRSEGTGLGLLFFPKTAVCSLAAYSALDVDFDVMPNNSGALVNAVDNQTCDLGTPLAPALKGALAIAKAKAIADPSRQYTVVVATDGLPDSSCTAGDVDVPPNTVDGVTSVAKEYYEGVPSVLTAFIGVGNALTELNGFAAAGGTGKANLIDPAGDTEAQMLKALEATKRRTLRCEYPLNAESEQLDKMKVNLAVTFSDVQATLTYVEQEAACTEDVDGWFYDDLENPTKTILCPATCDKFRDLSGASMKMAIGCNTKVVR